MLTVHHLQRSQSERILWLCEELSLPYELKLYQRDPIFSPPALVALSPLGAAPVITDSTPDPSKPLQLAESAAIVEYIIHKHGNGRLALPPSHKDYANYLYWFHMANGNLQPSLLRCTTFRSMKLEPDHPARKTVDSRLKLILNQMNDRLTQTPWLAGDEFTAADIMTVFSLTTMRLFYPIALTGYDGILSWLEQVGQRHAYRVAMEKGDPGFAPLLGAEAPQPFAGIANELYSPHENKYTLPPCQLPLRILGLKSARKVEDLAEEHRGLVLHRTALLRELLAPFPRELMQMSRKLASIEAESY